MYDLQQITLRNNNFLKLSFKIVVYTCLDIRITLKNKSKIKITYMRQ